MLVLTHASLLINNEQVSDVDQRVILNEMIRFLSHASAGVKSFDQMPASWTELVTRVQAGGKIAPNSSEARETVGAWYQEIRDLALIMSRELSTEVSTRISRAHASDPLARLKSDALTLAANESLVTILEVPDAAAAIEICADLAKRSIGVSMKLKAPADRKTTKARVNWLLRQFQKADDKDIYIRLFWPGRTPHTQFSLSALKNNPELCEQDRNGQSALSFEVILVRDLGARFGQRRNFISEIEKAVPEFYRQVGQYVKAWVPPAPKFREPKAEIGHSTPETLGREAEEFAEERSELRTEIS